MEVEYYIDFGDYSGSYDLFGAETGDTPEVIAKKVASDYWNDKSGNEDDWPIIFEIWVNKKRIGYFKIIPKVDFEILY